jgi:hypothetical protein
VPTIGIFVHLLAESMGLKDLAARIWDDALLESFANTDTATLLWALGSVIADTVTATDVVTGALTLNPVTADEVDLADVLVGGATLGNLLTEQIGFEITIILDGEVWQCWVLNTRDFHPSVYSNFNFNSFCEFEGVSYGAKSDGIYSLTGTTDAGATVHSGITFTQSNFGVLNKKRIRSAYLGVSGTTPVLKVITEEGTARYYVVSNDKAKVGREVYGREFTLSLSDFDELTFLEIVPIVLTR